MFGPCSVGYGSSPDGVSKIPAWFRPYVAAHVILSTTLFAALVGFATTLRARRRATLIHQQIESTELTEELIQEFDRNGDGVDKLEFMIGMLAKMDLVYYHDLKPLLTLFDKFDADGSGVITKEDIALRLNGGRERRRHRHRAARGTAAANVGHQLDVAARRMCMARR